MTNKSMQTNIKDAYLYSGTLAIIGCVSEVATNSFCRTVFGSPLWLYHVTPIHQGDTSIFAFFQWSLFGYHLYYVRKKIQSYHFSRYFRFGSLCRCVDAGNISQRIKQCIPGHVHFLLSA
ncbi:MAG TPA: hypothetical protein VIF37_08090 [Methylobacter sp.]